MIHCQTKVNPFPITAKVYRKDNDFAVGLLSFGSLYSLAGIHDLQSVVFRKVATVADSDEKVAEVTKQLLKHLEVSLRVKGHKLVGYELELTSQTYNLVTMVAGHMEAA